MRVVVDVNLGGAEGGADCGGCENSRVGASGRPSRCHISTQQVLLHHPSRVHSEVSRLSVVCWGGADLGYRCARYPFRSIQVNFSLFRSRAEILANFDIDCVTACFDGQRVYCLPRFRRAAISRVNMVNGAIRMTAYQRFYKCVGGNIGVCSRLTGYAVVCCGMSQQVCLAGFLVCATRCCASVGGGVSGRLATTAHPATQRRQRQ